MKNAFVIGLKVCLRPLEQEDAALVTEWVNAPEITRTLLLYRPISRSAEQEYLAQIARSEHDIVAGIQTLDGRLVGVVGLHGVDFKDRQASLGIFIGARDAWGRGYGTEAVRLMTGYGFETMNLNRIWLKVLECNPRALGVYERVGYRREGVLREDTYREGRYWDSLLLSILRSEWRPEAE
jgi:RimJ/RimL family protein N-acetyltransferase